MTDETAKALLAHANSEPDRDEAAKIRAHLAANGRDPYTGASNVVTTDQRLRQELEDQGMDEDLIAEAEAQIQDVMDELGCS